MCIPVMPDVRLSIESQHQALKATHQSSSSSAAASDAAAAPRRTKRSTHDTFSLMSLNARPRTSPPENGAPMEKRSTKRARTCKHRPGAREVSAHCRQASSDAASTHSLWDGQAEKQVCEAAEWRLNAAATAPGTARAAMAHYRTSQITTRLSSGQPNAHETLGSLPAHGQFSRQTL